MDPLDFDLNSAITAMLLCDPDNAAQMVAWLRTKEGRDAMKRAASKSEVATESVSLAHRNAKEIAEYVSEVSRTEGLPIVSLRGQEWLEEKLVAEGFTGFITDTLDRLRRYRDGIQIAVSDSNFYRMRRGVTPRRNPDLLLPAVEQIQAIKPSSSVARSNASDARPDNLIESGRVQKYENFALMADRTTNAVRNAPRFGELGKKVLAGHLGQPNPDLPEQSRPPMTVEQIGALREFSNPEGTYARDPRQGRFGTAASGTSSDDPHRLERAAGELLDEVFSKIPRFPKQVAVLKRFRTPPDQDSDIVTRAEQSLKSGIPLMFPGITSGRVVSELESPPPAGQGEDVEFRIMAEHGLDARQYSDYAGKTFGGKKNEDIRQILMAADSLFKVTSVAKTPEGRTIVSVEQVSDGARGVDGGKRYRRGINLFTGSHDVPRKVGGASGNFLAARLR